MDRRIALLSAALAACTPEGGVDYLNPNLPETVDTTTIETVETVGTTPNPEVDDSNIRWETAQFRALMDPAFGINGSLCPPPGVDYRCAPVADTDLDELQEGVVQAFGVEGLDGNSPTIEDFLNRRFDGSVAVAATGIDTTDGIRISFTLLEPGDGIPEPISELAIFSPAKPTFYCDLFRYEGVTGGYMSCQLETPQYFLGETYAHLHIVPSGNMLNIAGLAYSNVDATAFNSAFQDLEGAINTAWDEGPQVFDSTLTND